MANGSAPLESGTLEILASTPATLDALLRNAPVELQDRSDAGGWSTRHVLAHLLTVDKPAIRDRIQTMLDEDNPSIANVGADAALKASEHRELPLDELLTRFAEERRLTVEILQSLDDAAWRRTAAHEQVGPISVADVVHHFAAHDMLHVGQIAAMLGEPAGRAQGNMGKMD